MIAGTGNIAGPLTGMGMQATARLMTHAARTTFTPPDADAHAQTSSIQFIEDALRLPLEHKRIDESPESIEERFNRDPDFRSYDAGTKRMLKSIFWTGS